MNPSPYDQPGNYPQGGPAGQPGPGGYLPGPAPVPSFPPPPTPSPANAGRRELTARLPLQRVWVTYVLLAVIVLVFIGQLVSLYVFGEDIVLDLGAKVNQLIAQGEFWRLFTAIFIHDDTFPYLHILFNGYALYIVGRDVERLSGSTRMALIFFLSGLSGSVASFLLSPSPSIGASGAIFGLIGAEAVFFYKHRQLLGQRAMRNLQQIIIIAIINFAFGLQGSIDNWAHAGGLIGGLILGFALGPTWAVTFDPMQGGQPAVVDQQPLGGREWLLALAFAVAVAAIAAVGTQLYISPAR